MLSLIVEISQSMLKGNEFDLSALLKCMQSLQCVCPIVPHIVPLQDCLPGIQQAQEAIWGHQSAFRALGQIAIGPQNEFLRTLSELWQAVSFSQHKPMYCVAQIVTLPPAISLSVYHCFAKKRIVHHWLEIW